MLVFLLILLIAGLGGFGYWASTQGYLKGFNFSSGNATTTSGQKLTTAPKISNIKITATGVDGFCVTWDTDQFSSSQVEYGPKGSYTTKTDVTDTPSSTSQGIMTSHGACIKGLAAKTDYQYRVISKNKDGLEGMSDVNYVSTPSSE